METLEKIKQAINLRKPISFEYNKPEKVQGIRIGNPHAIFNFTSKSGQRSIKVHLVQTGGVSDTKHEKPFPDFRMFDIESINIVTILENEIGFPISEKYNSDWEGYRDAIAKI